MNTERPAHTGIEYTIESVGPDTAVLWLKGSADLAGHDRVMEIFVQAVRHPARNVVLDLRHLEFITSLGVGEMLSLHKVKKNAGGGVAIAGATEWVRSVLKKARVDAVMPLHDTVEGAVKTMK